VLGRFGKDKGQMGEDDPWEGDGKIELNTDEEMRLRNAARLAKSVREFTSGLVKVCLVSNCFK
jgi:methionyl aminopeptidase